MIEESQKKSALLVATLASFLTPFMGSAVNLAVPSLGEQFGSTTVMLSWVVTSYLLASAAFLVPFGRAADLWGRKKVFTIGVTLHTIFSFLSAVAGSMEALIFFRGLQGFGGAMIFSTAVAILTSVYPPHERGKVLGFNAAAVYTGLSLGPVLGGMLAHYLGWRSIFYFTALCGLPIIYFALFKLKGEWAEAKGENYDIAGALIYVFALIALMYGLSSLAAVAWAKWLLLIGLLGLVMFIMLQLKTPSPVLNLKLFSDNKAFIYSNLAALINYSATFAVGFMLSLNLQVVRGFDPQQAGLILLFQPVVMALLSPLAGKLSDRIEPRIVASAGMLLTVIGLLVFYFIDYFSGLWAVMANLSLLGAGFALFSSPNTNAVMSSTEKKFYGVASSTLGTMRLTGQAFSMSIVTLLLAHYVGNIQLTKDSAFLLLAGTKATFLIFAVICIFGVFASMARGEIRSEAKAEGTR
ncbi:MAG: Multidrug resistance protein stp [Pelotomaculum sp. PtaB.Bin104]|nr:MAG: Multidrug resistance protein stp [Pelotomaculum sp. PtaB.Bin104]